MTLGASTAASWPQVASSMPDVHTSVTLPGFQFVWDDTVYRRGDPEGHLETHAAIRAAIETMRDPDEGIQTVLYPMAGFDARTTRLFPEASFFIAIDNHPFFRDVPKPDEVIKYNDVGFRHWYSFDRVSRLTHAGLFPGHLVIGALASVVPGFRIRQVTIFNKAFQALDGQWKGANGLIEYDSGPGTDHKYYLHIHDQLWVQHGESGWWLSMLDTLKPDALIVKAAMGNFHPQSSTCLTALRMRILDWLTETGGIIIEGWDNRTPIGWEFTTGLPFSKDQQVQLVGQKLEYGYSGDVQVTVLD